MSEVRAGVPFSPSAPHALQQPSPRHRCGQTSPAAVVALIPRRSRQARGPRVEVGTGSGYQAAGPGRLVRHLITSSSSPRSRNTRRRRCYPARLLHVEVAVRRTFGWPAYAPTTYLVRPPRPTWPALMDSLAPEGRLVIRWGDHPMTPGPAHLSRGGDDCCPVAFPVRFVPLRWMGGRRRRATRRWEAPPVGRAPSRSAAAVKKAPRSSSGREAREVAVLQSAYASA